MRRSVCGPSDCRAKEERQVLSVKEKDAPECEPSNTASKAVVDSSIGGVEKSRPYGTRGLKLSADFLLRTMDVDTEDMISGEADRCPPS